MIIGDQTMKRYYETPESEEILLSSSFSILVYNGGNEDFDDPEDDD